MLRLANWLLLPCLILAACSSDTKPVGDAPPSYQPKGMLKVAQFEFRLEDPDPRSKAPLRTVFASGNRIRLCKEVLFNNRDLVDARLGYDEIFETSNLWLIFSPAAGRRLKEITRKNIGKRLAILVDGNVWIAARILQEISGGRASISGKRVEPYINRLNERLKQIVR